MNIEAPGKFGKKASNVENALETSLKSFWRRKVGRYKKLTDIEKIRQKPDFGRSNHLFLEKLSL